MDSQASKLLHKKPKAKQRSEAYLKYQRYIRSKAFKEIREIIFNRDNHKCCVCGWSPSEGGKRTLTCHHIRYNNLFNEKDHLEDLITLCSVCHKAIHSAKSNYQRFKFRNNESEN